MNDLPDLIESYLRGVEELKLAATGLSSAELRSHPIAGTWSIHEVVCHVADFEIISADRIQRLIAEERPTIFNAEPEPFAERLAYEQRDTNRELELIAALRGHVATILRSLRPEQWDRVGIHSADGPLTLTQLVQRITRHIPHHLKFIAEKRAALGKN